MHARNKHSTAALADGAATAEGSARLARRHAPSAPPARSSASTTSSDSPSAPPRGGALTADPTFYRDAFGLTLSSIGIGTYLGECDADDDDAYRQSIAEALRLGINLIDTAINYRCQRSERAIGIALRAMLAAGSVARDEITICTKGGDIPLEETAPATREDYQEYLSREYFETGVMRPDDVVAGGHSLAPSFLADQIERSCSNLGMRTLDVYYLHNPEQQLSVISPEALRERLRAAFELLEARCAEGKIGRYGCATWNGLRTPPTERGHISLAELLSIAREVAGEKHHFSVVQAPINLAMTEAVRAPTQRLRGGRIVPLLEAASELGVAVVASASLAQGRLASLPPQVRDALPDYANDAQRAVAFVRSLPMVCTALVGMKHPAHVQQNLGVTVDGASSARTKDAPT
jgi:aryl-alcohol dehydrogenase-like predicted oxidoreductase